MTLGDSAPGHDRQEVRSESGFAYGAVGADIHVFGDGTPVYLLFEHRQPPVLDPEWLRAQPSRMLDARAEIVDFTGRNTEFRDLVTWRDTDKRFAVRWLHGEGGQGKTRLANQFASHSQLAGWKVVVAVHGTDTSPPTHGSQDLRLHESVGVLLVVDYADRWSISELTWLFHNGLLRQSARIRILLIGRSVTMWPAIRSKLTRLRENVDTSDQELPPLPDDRHTRDRMFAAARDSFARRYPPTVDFTAVEPPGPLHHPDFGLTLAVHMAALVAVDATAVGCRPPTGMIGLTTYLLDREHENWCQLYQNASSGIDYRTPEGVMRRTVFTAILTGSSDRAIAQPLLEGLMPQESAERTLTDHAVCYPPTDLARSNVLEPLAPDRLAEDFLAVTLPGSPVSGYATDPWSASTPTILLSGDHRGEPPAWTPRTVTFLAAAAERWPHVGERHLYPLLHRSPVLALNAGNAALESIARLEPAVDTLSPSLTAVLEAIESLFPVRAYEIDAGIAAVADRLLRHRRTGTTDPATIAKWCTEIAPLYSNASRNTESLTALREAVEIYRKLADTDRSTFLPDLAGSLLGLGITLHEFGHYTTALAVAQEAVATYRELAERDESAERGLARSLFNLAITLNGVGQGERALTHAEEAVSILRRLTQADPLEFQYDLAAALANVGLWLSILGRWPAALAATNDAFEIQLQIAENEDDPIGYFPELVASLINLNVWLSGLGEHQQALQYAEFAVAGCRHLTKLNPARFKQSLAGSLDNLGARLSEVSRWDEALSAAEEAVSLHRELTNENPAHGPQLAASLNNLGLWLLGLGQRESALINIEEAVTIRRLLVESDPRAFAPHLAKSLTNLGIVLSAVGRSEDALTPSREAVDIRRRLAAINDAYTPELALALHNLGSRLFGLGRWDEGLSPTLEAVDIRRRLAKTFPRTYEPELAASLSNLGGALARLKHWEDATLSLRESVAINRRLPKANPAVSPLNLALALVNLGGALVQLKHREEALAAVSEAVEICRALTESNEAHLPHLAASLRAVAQVQAEMNDIPAALQAAQESVAIYTTLAQQHSEAFAADLRSAAEVLADILDEVDHGVDPDNIDGSLGTQSQ